jgi:hypothetical protein
MTYTVYDPRLLHDAVKVQLETGTGKDVGKGQRPVNAEPPYSVLRGFTAPPSEGGLSDPNQISHPTFLVFYVGADADSAQWLQEKARTSLLGWSPTLAGFAPGPVELDLENVIDGPDFDGPVYEIADRYSIFLS